jgi:hypothetical protein
MGTWVLLLLLLLLLGPVDLGRGDDTGMHPFFL